MFIINTFSTCFGHHYAHLQENKTCVRARLKRDGTCAETRFSLSAKRTSPFKSAGGRHFSRLLAAELCASAVVMLDTSCSEVECKTTGYPLHSHVSPSLLLPCVTVCHQVSTELYCTWWAALVLLDVVGSGCGALRSYNTAPHNHYQPHPAEPAHYTICSNTRSLFSWRWA